MPFRTSLFQQPCVVLSQYNVAFIVDKILFCQDFPFPPFISTLSQILVLLISCRNVLLLHESLCLFSNQKKCRGRILTCTFSENAVARNEQTFFQQLQRKSF